MKRVSSNLTLNITSAVVSENRDTAPQTQDKKPSPFLLPTTDNFAKGGSKTQLPTPIISSILDFMPRDEDLLSKRRVGQGWDEVVKKQFEDEVTATLVAERLLADPSLKDDALLLSRDDRVKELATHRKLRTTSERAKKIKRGAKKVQKFSMKPLAGAERILNGQNTCCFGPAAFAIVSPAILPVVGAYSVKKVANLHHWYVERKIDQQKERLSSTLEELRKNQELAPNETENP